jgi:hypothetical protein
MKINFTGDFDQNMSNMIIQDIQTIASRSNPDIRVASEIYGKTITFTIHEVALPKKSDLPYDQANMLGRCTVFLLTLINTQKPIVVKIDDKSVTIADISIDAGLVEHYQNNDLGITLSHNQASYAFYTPEDGELFSKLESLVGNILSYIHSLSHNTVLSIRIKIEDKK